MGSKHCWHIQYEVLPYLPAELTNVLFCGIQLSFHLLLVCLNTAGQSEITTGQQEMLRNHCRTVLSKGVEA